MSTPYQPSNVDPSFSQAQRLWLQREFAALKKALELAKSSDQFRPLSAAPAKTFAGEIVYADGSNWNPGSGEGVYRRDKTNSSWVFLG